MVVLDAVAIIALMKDEPAAEEVALLVRRPTVMNAVNYAEVIDHLIRIFRKDRDWIDLVLAPIMSSSLRVLVTDANLAEQAGEIRSRHYTSKDAPISLADSFAIATALHMRLPLATSDPAIARIMRDLAHEVVALPDSHGRLP